MNQKAIGQKIRTLRASKGLTTVTLARKVKLSQAQVSRLENGLQGFRSETLLRFAKVLEVPPVYFFLEGEDTSVKVVAEVLEEHGLTPSKVLRKAMTDPAFLKFVEKCARADKTHKKNLARMERAARRVIR